jgi:hypothetical protein
VSSDCWDMRTHHNGTVPECVNLAHDLSGALYFEHSKKIFIYAMIYTLSIHSTNQKYVVVYSTQKDKIIGLGL